VMSVAGRRTVAKLGMVQAFRHTTRPVHVTPMTGPRQGV